MSFYKRSMKKLVKQKILYFQGFSDTLFLHSRTICCKIFRKIGDGIALDRHGRGRPREARGCCGVYARGVVDKIRIKAALPHLLFGERAGELVNDRANHFQMTQFLSTHIGVKKDTNSKSLEKSKLSGPVSGGKPECAGFRIPLFHGAAAAHQAEKG